MHGTVGKFMQGCDDWSTYMQTSQPENTVGSVILPYTDTNEKSNRICILQCLCL